MNSTLISDPMDVDKLMQTVQNLLSQEIHSPQAPAKQFRRRRIVGSEGRPPLAPLT